MTGGTQATGGDGTLRWLTVAAGLGMVAVDVAGIYALLDSFAVPDVALYGATAATAAVIGGSFVSVFGPRLFGSGAGVNAEAKSTVQRVSEVVVSVTVLSGVTVVLGVGGGLLLTLLAALGGPDPKTDDGEPLRERLLDWVGRNRDFMRTEGRGDLPVTP